MSGELAVLAMDRLTTNVHKSTLAMVTGVSVAKKRLSLLKAQYYEYALKKQIELTFGNVAAVEDKTNIQHFRHLTKTYSKSGTFK